MDNLGGLATDFIGAATNLCRTMALELCLQGLFFLVEGRASLELR